MSNTHRAYIETSGPPSMDLIAAGPRSHCDDALSRWIEKHPLTEYQAAVVAEVVMYIEVPA